MFGGQFHTSKRLNLLYDDVERYYNLITNLTGAVARRHNSNACHKIYRSDITHICEQTCCHCMARPPCAFSDFRLPCEECNRLLKVGHISLTTSRAPKRENSYANVNNVAQLVDYSWRTKFTNVINDFVLTVSRIKA